MSDWSKPPDWPEPPAWLGKLMAVAGCIGLLAIGIISGGQARTWLTVAAVCCLLAIALEAGWLGTGDRQ